MIPPNKNRCSFYIHFFFTYYYRLCSSLCHTSQVCLIVLLFQARIPKAILEAKAREDEDKTPTSSNPNSPTKVEIVEPPSPSLKSSKLKLSIHHISPSKKPVLRVAPIISPTAQAAQLNKKSVVRESPLQPLLSSLSSKQQVNDAEIIQNGFQRVIDREPVLETLQKCLKTDELKLQYPKITIQRLPDMKNATVQRVIEKKDSAGTGATMGIAPNIRFDKIAQEWNQGRKRKPSISDAETLSSPEEDEDEIVQARKVSILPFILLDRLHQWLGCDLAVVL